MNAKNRLIAETCRCRELPLNFGTPEVTVPDAKNPSLGENCRCRELPLNFGTPEK